MTTHHDLSAPSSGQRSALVVLVPEAEPVVGAWRKHLDPSADLGVPAHLTILFPFLAPEDIDDGVRARLTQVFHKVDAFDFVLDRVGWFGNDVVWLGPTPVAPFIVLMDRVLKQWPEHPPYGGAFEEVVPHLTVGDGGPSDLMHRAADEIAPRLPIRGRAREVHLIAGSGKPGSWTTSEAFALRER